MEVSVIKLDDYTQIDDEYDDMIGSSHQKYIIMQKRTFTIPKRTNLQTFFGTARKKCNIPNNVDIRVFEVHGSKKDLITFPYKFQLSKYHLMIERGRYPKYNEVFLWVKSLTNHNDPNDFQLIKKIDKSTQYLVTGYIKKCEKELLLNQNITKFITYKCLLFYAEINV